MHRADIKKLEDILTNLNKYRTYLRVRAIELEDNASERLGKKQVKHADAQDPRTITGQGSNSSVIERTIVKRDNDLEYQMLYSIVNNTPKFLETLDEYEAFIYEHRYQEVDMTVYEWEDIAMGLTDMNDDFKVFSKSTTLRIRNKMLKRLADYIGYTFI